MNTVSERSLVIRLQERFRYGLAVQEVLDSLHRWFRVIVCPYYVVQEDCRPTSLPGNEMPEHYEIRFLDESDLDALRQIASAPPPTGRLEASMQRGRCLGLFLDKRLAACSWSRTDFIPVPNSGRAPLRALADDEAYLFGALVSRDYRGRRLAPVLRQAAYRLLKQTGKRRLYSVTLVFNRSSRRFKARLGARELELRLVLGIARWRAIDIRVRRLAGDAQSPAFTLLDLSTPRLMRSVNHEATPPQL